jgi:predicted CoA-substrate-specific enzyme activase
VVFAGGVSRNSAVQKHVESIVQEPMIVDDYGHLYGAIGAAIEALTNTAAHDTERLAAGGVRAKRPLPERLRAEEPATRTYQYDPLGETRCDYPDFHAHRTTRFTAPSADGRMVEVDLYLEPLTETRHLPVRLGVDIGSTSTKAVLLGTDGSVVAGYYTRTSGTPVRAIQAVFEAIDATAAREGWELEIVGAATTGSGRSFVGAIIGADLVLDEITAHARAATEIDPDIDTIIEIGGQDAKFTTLRNGVVTFSQMNAVCAAGTGSFLEEQADKLGVPLSAYADEAAGASAPLASDRCTVFMERDINNYLNRGYSTREILAAALHSVRENYLHKVANTAVIGSRICFQGATAKNRALVAAFEHKLDQPISVSLYCHLTGAYGAALVLADEAAPAEHATSFRGLDLYREDVPVETELCTYCANHCRIRLTEVKGQRVAYGFLCGRDYDTPRRVSDNASGFDLLRARHDLWKELVTAEARTRPRAIPHWTDRGHLPTIGVPTGVYLASTHRFWTSFFDVLGVPTVTTERTKQTVQRGRRLAGAEFCAPMMQLHGQAAELLDRADYVFLPMQLETSEAPRAGSPRNYCYYSQLASSILPEINGGKARERFLRPLVRPGEGPGQGKTNVDELNRALAPLIPGLSRAEVSDAYQRARDLHERYQRRLQQRFLELVNETAPSPDHYDVVLIGRPYTILSEEMNHRIPQIFAKHGVRTFYQDMVPTAQEERTSIDPLLQEIPWSYAARILETAATCARRDGLYPVLVTSFKCSPDSFIVDYFTKILDAFDKPYLILQLDDHDSSVGYETRIEAALRAFANHHRRDHVEVTSHEDTARVGGETPAVGPVLSPSMEGKTVLFPNWDSLTNRLIVAGLRSRGVDARLLHEDQITIQRSMRTNSGQCIPVNVIAEESLSYVQSEGLDPEQTVLWMPRSKWACNIPLYPHYIKSVFDAAKVPIGVYSGDFTLKDVSLGATYDAYFGYLFGGMLRRIGCMIRPYEANSGETNRVLTRSIAYLEDTFASRQSKADAWEEVIGQLMAIERRPGPRKPQVAIFGDLYTRDNDTANQNLIETIEEAGGEVVTTPYSDYVKVIATAHFRKLFRQRDLLQWGTLRAVHAVLSTVERRFYRPLSDLMPEGPLDTTEQNIEEELAKFNMRSEQSGESVENVLKIFHILRHHPDVSLFVQASPAFCCPSLITESMASRIQDLTGVPVVSVTYDGTGAYQNEIIVPYLKLAG